jgi:hypothetical protein
MLPAVVGMLPMAAEVFPVDRWMRHLKIYLQPLVTNAPLWRLIHY